MSRRSKETLAVQLFPFLAVLVCTMGSLIFLLLVTTRQIRQRAVAYAAFQLAQQQPAAVEAFSLPTPDLPPVEPEKPPEVPTVLIPAQPKRAEKTVKLPDQSYVLSLADRQREQNELHVKWKLRVSQLSKERDGELESIARQRLLVDKSLHQTKAAKSDVEVLESQLGTIAGEAAAASLTAADDAERLLLEKQIAELKKQLRAAQIAEAADSAKFQVVPFDPQTGTTRRPIFIECTEQGIRFQPEDILITPADLDGFTNRVNPLAAGTGALINYWAAWNSRQRNPRAEPEPYVLLLVRPKGVFAYYAALRMLDPIRTAHGYELIEESTSLQLPEVDAGAKLVCQAAVDRLLAERENIFRDAVNSGSGGMVFGGTGRVLNSGTGKGGAQATGTYAERMAAMRRADGNAFNLSDMTGNDRPVGDRSWQNVENFSGQQRRRRNGGGTQGPTGVASGTPVDNGAPPGTGLTGTNGGMLPGTGQTGTNGGVLPGTNGSVLPGTSSGVLPNRQSAGGGYAPGNPSTGSRTGQSIAAVGPPGSPNSGQGNPRTFSGGTNGTAGTNGTNGGQDWNSTSSVPEMPVGQRPGKKRGQSSQTSDPSSDGQEGDLDDEFADGDGSGQGGPNSGGQSGGRPNSLFSDNPSSSRRHANGSRLSAMSTTPNQRSKASDQNSDRQLEPEMLAGRHWGFSEAGAGIGYEREVRVDVSADKLVIAEKFTVPIEPDGSKQETFEEFATVLDRYSHEWGRPPQGFFWTPRLKFVVKPEANSRYEQLNALMTRAGLATSHEFAKDTANVEFGREPLSSTKLPSKTSSNPIPGVNR